MTDSPRDRSAVTPVITSAASWAPERVLRPDQVERLINRLFPELRGSSVRPLAEGWDNTVFLVGDDLVFRFPRRAMAVPGVRREISVLAAIGPKLPLSVPTPEYVGVDDDEQVEDPWPFFGARLIRGTELALSTLSEAARVPAAGAAGAFLRALHAPATLAAAQAAAGEPLLHDPMHRAWPQARIADTRNLLRSLTDDGGWVSDSRVGRLLEEAAELPAPQSEPTLVHGDLHIRHLLIERTSGAARATGVIDWGDICAGDPAIDLSLSYAAFQDGAREAFLDAYGPVDAERELRARALAIRLSATLATYALATRQSELAAESLRGLRRAVG